MLLINKFSRGKNLLLNPIIFNNILCHLLDAIGKNWNFSFKGKLITEHYLQTWHYLSSSSIIRNANTWELQPNAAIRQKKKKQNTTPEKRCKKKEEKLNMQQKNALNGLSSWSFSNRNSSIVVVINYPINYSKKKRKEMQNKHKNKNNWAAQHNSLKSKQTI